MSAAAAVGEKKIPHSSGNCSVVLPRVDKNSQVVFREIMVLVSFPGSNESLGMMLV